MALSVATGSDWWGRKTTPGQVLYINFEIQNPFFYERLQKICDARKISLGSEQLDVWNLRGYAADLSQLTPQILTRVEASNYALIVIDPIYKCLGNRDENSAGDITGLMNEIENVCAKTHAAVAFGAHFSKGNQAAKESMDRIGGSGVFARDPDSILVLTRHEKEGVFVVEATLRNFKPLEPFCIEWEYPLMKLTNAFSPKDLKKAHNRQVRCVPDALEVLELFPKRSSRDPRKALLSNKDLEQLFKEKGFDKNSIVSIRDELENGNFIKVLRNRPRNEVLAGRPELVQNLLESEKLKRSAKEKGSVLQSSRRTRELIPVAESVVLSVSSPPSLEGENY
jgi:hypothetical protein